jgi:hypothetical protein
VKMMGAIYFVKDNRRGKETLNQHYRLRPHPEGLLMDLKVHGNLK